MSHYRVRFRAGHRVRTRVRLALESCKPYILYYVLVITWSTVDYTSVTSIMHCRHVITFLFHAATSVIRLVAANRTA